MEKDNWMVDEKCNKLRSTDEKNEDMIEVCKLIGGKEGEER